MISVIVPVYNSAPYLRQCIQSIQAQTYRELEIICIDDGSTDESLSILQDLAGEDPRVFVLSQKNSGVSAARNTGLKAAHGEFITFVDSDDELEPDMYATLLDLAGKYNADIAHCGYKKILLDGTAKNVCGTNILLVQTSTEATKCLLTGQYFVGGLWNKLYRRKLFSGISFDTSLRINEDVLMNVQIFLRANKLVFFDVPKYHYFQRTNSACSRTNIVKKQKDCVSAAEKIMALTNNSELHAICAGRLRHALVDLYRTYLYADERGTRSVRKEINKRIHSLDSLCTQISFRSRINYYLMRYFPHLYRATYSIYDHVRKPNWDL